jgi:hypothetical protein
MSFGVSKMKQEDVLFRNSVVKSELAGLKWYGYDFMAKNDGMISYWDLYLLLCSLKMKSW